MAIKHLSFLAVALVGSQTASAQTTTLEIDLIAVRPT
jgi:hypothetical protein